MCYLFVTGGHFIIEIISDNKEILVKTCNKESLISQLNELRQICAATIGTIAHDHALPMDKVMGGFLLLLEEDADWGPVLIETRGVNNKTEGRKGQNRS
jgi:hypothetical protein